MKHVGITLKHTPGKYNENLRNPIWAAQISLFFYQPVLHVLGRALALEVELDVVESGADFVERRLWVEVGIALGEQGADVA